MAILVQEQKKGVNWFAIVVTLIIAAVVGLAAYFLFFIAPPGIEIIVPQQLESVIEISKIKFDPTAVINSPAFRSLRSYVGLPSAGQLGRANPFLEF
jgi:hypothetical protein